LDEAEKLIRKAVDEDRKRARKGKEETAEEKAANAAYLDSLGWVLYKRKKYDDAKSYLQQAVTQKEGQHIEIYDHLGDVLSALGQKDEAISAWKKGLEVVGSSKREQERKTIVEQKLKQDQ